MPDERRRARSKCVSRSRALRAQSTFAAPIGSRCPHRRSAGLPARRAGNISSSDYTVRGNGFPSCRELDRRCLLTRNLIAAFGRDVSRCLSRRKRNYPSVPTTSHRQMRAARGSRRPLVAGARSERRCTAAGQFPLTRMLIFFFLNRCKKS